MLFRGSSFFNLLFAVTRCPGQCAFVLELAKLRDVSGLATFTRNHDFPKPDGGHSALAPITIARTHRCVDFPPGSRATNSNRVDCEARNASDRATVIIAIVAAISFAETPTFAVSHADAPAVATANRQD